MSDTDASRDFRWYRQEAACVRQKARAVKNNAELRDSYLALALECERLAAILENRSSAG